MHSKEKNDVSRTTAEIPEIKSSFKPDAVKKNDTASPARPVKQYTIEDIDKLIEQTAFRTPKKPDNAKTIAFSVNKEKEEKKTETAQKQPAVQKIQAEITSVTMDELKAAAAAEPKADEEQKTVTQAQYLTEPIPDDEEEKNTELSEAFDKLKKNAQKLSEKIKLAVSAQKEKFKRALKDNTETEKYISPFEDDACEEIFDLPPEEAEALKQKRSLEKQLSEAVEESHIYDPKQGYDSEAESGQLRFIAAEAEVIKTTQEKINVSAGEEISSPQGAFVSPHTKTLHTGIDEIINHPQDSEASPSKRYIQPPTMKTGRVPVMKANEDDFLLGTDGKYIQVPEDYVDPFAKKEFDFEEAEAEFSDSAQIQPKEESQLDGQTRLDGFEESESVEKIDEEEAEQILFEKRREKVTNFQLDENAAAQAAQSQPKKNIKTSRVPENESVFSHPDEAPFFRSLLRDKRTTAFIKAVCLGILSFILLYLGIFPGSPAFISLIRPSLHPYAYITVSLILGAACAAVSRKELIQGILNLKDKKFDSTCVVTVSFCAALLQNLMFFAAKDGIMQGSYHLYLSVAALSLTALQIGDYLKFTTAAYNLRVLMRKEEAESIQTVKDSADAQEMARGAMPDDASLAYSVKTGFGTDFIRIAESTCKQEQTFARIIPLLWGGAGAVFLLSLITQQNFFHALSGFTAVLCVCAPLTLTLTANLPLRKTNRILNEKASFIGGAESIEAFADTSAVILDSTLLFPAGSVQLYGFKPFNGMPVDDAILYAAALEHACGGPLAQAFDLVIEQRSDILPAVDDLTYEDRLGVSAWIYAHRVLLGTREMMLHHEVAVPPVTTERKRLENDPSRRILYLAVGGQVSAMFVVGYTADPRTTDLLTKLEQHGTGLLIRTTDPHIDENMIADYFELSDTCVKVLSPVGEVIYKEKYTAARAKAPAHLIHRGGLSGFARCILSAEALSEKIHLLTVLQGLGVGLGFVLMAFLSVFAGMTQIAPTQLLIYQVFWCVIVTAMNLIQNSDSDIE